MVTAYAKEHLLHEAQGLQIDDILIKPITPSLLFSTICAQELIAIPNQQFGALNFGEGAMDIADITRELKGCKVLLVEDNILNQEVAVGVLDKFGIATTVANDGQEAVEIVASSSFDCVLMDMHMPIMDGIEATRLIRQIESAKFLPIIAMTAAATQKDKLSCREAGMNDHISKPISVDVVANTLLKWIKNIQIAHVGKVSKEVSDNESPMIRDIMSRLLLKRDTVVAILKTFLASFEDFMPQLESQLVASNYNAASLLLHKIKGSSGNVCANSLFAASEKLETELSGGTHTNESLMEFKAEFEKIMADVKNEVGTNIPKHVHTASRMEALQSLDMLKQKVMNSEMIDYETKESLFEHIRGYSFDEAAVKKLDRAVDNFDHKNALETIDIFLAQLGKETNE